MNKNIFGLSERLASALSYFPYIGGIVFLIAEKKNKTIRFNAIQSIFITLMFVALRFVALALKVQHFNVSVALNQFVEIGAPIIVLLFGTMSAFGKKINIPVLGKVAEKFS